MLEKVLSLGLIFLCLTAFTGCNTVRGLGEDIKKGGEAIQKATK